MPSLVKVAHAARPRRLDIPYYQLWKEEEESCQLHGIKKTWLKE